MTKSKIAIVATLATLVAAPAFAMDQDTAAVTINSGRYLPELNLAASRVRAPTNAFASTRPGRVHVNPVQSIGPTGRRDFALEGRDLGD
jgi:hypothetical protein